MQPTKPKATQQDFIQPGAINVTHPVQPLQRNVIRLDPTTQPTQGEVLTQTDSVQPNAIFIQDPYNRQLVNMQTGERKNHCKGHCNRWIDPTTVSILLCEQPH